MNANDSVIVELRCVNNQFKKFMKNYKHGETPYQFLLETESRTCYFRILGSDIVTDESKCFAYGKELFGKIIYYEGHPFKKAVDIVMLSENGKFNPNVKICLSTTGYHMANSGITFECHMLGLMSFFKDETPFGGVGAVDHEYFTKKEELENYIKNYSSSHSAGVAALKVRFEETYRQQ